MKTSTRRKRKQCRWSEPPAPRRRSRWGSTKERVKITPQILAVTNQMTVEQREMYLLQLRIQEISQKLLNVRALATMKRDDRSPSPEPVYDHNGVRINTRENRLRDKLSDERAQLIERALKLNPNYIPPSDFQKPKLQRMIPIPVDDYPDYNFIGLIIGPRGNTQKRMERETNTKIAIRGRGSVKEGRRRDGQPQPGDDEPLHVLVSADTHADLERATDMIKKILVPVDDSKNMHKARQLQELAKYNGTLLDDIECRVCGEVGHRMYNCPQRPRPEWTPANVRCAICGDRSHPTADCPSGKKQSEEERANLESSYASLMAEISGNQRRY